jgi:hypothetical protein
MSPANQFPHHGGADQACSTENENAHDLPRCGNPVRLMLRFPLWPLRKLRTDIAAHARGRKKVQNEIASKKNFSQFVSV